jgi:hypothetical protein
MMMSLHTTPKQTLLLVCPDPSWLYPRWLYTIVDRFVLGHGLDLHMSFGSAGEQDAGLTRTQVPEL